MAQRRPGVTCLHAARRGRQILKPEWPTHFCWSEKHKGQRPGLRPGDLDGRRDHQWEREPSVAGPGGQGWMACGWREESWEGQRERRAGSWENGGPWVSGHPGAALGLGLCREWGSGGGRRCWADGKRPGHSAGHAGRHPARALCPARVTHSGERRTEASRPFHKTLVRQGSHMEGGQPGRSAFRWPPRPAPQDPARLLENN